MNDKIRQFENNATVIKYGFNTTQAKPLSDSDTNRYGFGPPITEDKGISTRTFEYRGERRKYCWMINEEGKRFLYMGKRYFMLDGCARELEGESFNNLFASGTLVT